MKKKIGYCTGYRLDIIEKVDLLKHWHNCDEVVIDYDSIYNNEREKIRYIKDNLFQNDILCLNNFNELNMDIDFIMEFINDLLKKGVVVRSVENDYASYLRGNKITAEDVENNFYTGKIKTTVGRKNKLLPKYANEIFRLYREKIIDITKAKYLLGIKKTKFFEEIKKYDESQNKT